MIANPTLGRLSSALTENDARSVIRTIFQGHTDADLVEAWQRAGGEAGDPLADLTPVEMERQETVF